MHTLQRDNVSNDYSCCTPTNLIQSALRREDGDMTVISSTATPRHLDDLQTTLMLAYHLLFDDLDKMTFELSGWVSLDSKPRHCDYESRQGTLALPNKCL